MFHILHPATPGWLDAVKLLPDGALVKATSPQMLSEVISINPNIFTMLRYVNDPLQDVNPDDTDLIRANRARHWFNQFIDGTFLNGETCGVAHAKAVKSIGWWNEYYADSQSPEEKEFFIKQEKIAAQVWNLEYRNGPLSNKLSHIRLVTCATAVGNNIPLESAKIANAFDCILDYHGYDKYIAPHVRDSLSWKFHSGRWQSMDSFFRANGYYVDWLLGESGPYATVVDGWRSPLVLNGDVDKYVAAVKRFLSEIKSSHAYQTGRFFGFALFTTGGNWPLYSTKAYEMIEIAKVIASDWELIPSQPTTPPVPSLPDPKLISHLHSVSLVAQIKHGLWLNSKAALQQKITDDGAGPTWWAVHREVSTTYDGKDYTVQAAEHTATGERRVYVYQEGKPIWWFN